MGRQTADPAMIHSSIALLQERFRQLQRVREIREERELLRLFSQAKWASSATHCEPSTLFFHPDLILPSRSLQNSSLPLQSGSNGKFTDHQDAVESLLLMTLWPDRPVTQASKNNFDDTDVDTSLHL